MIGKAAYPAPDEPNREVDNHPPLPPGKARRQANSESTDQIYSHDDLIAAYYHHEKASRPAALVDEITRETPRLAWGLLNAFLAYAGPDEARGKLLGSLMRSFIRKHGIALLPQIIEAARDDSGLRRCLSWAFALDAKMRRNIPMEIKQELAPYTTMDTPSSNEKVSRPLVHPGSLALAADWFAHQETYWAEDGFRALFRSDPRQAWSVLSAVLRRASGETQVLMDLADGPLRVLLKHHGQELKDCLIAEKSLSQGLCYCLSYLEYNPE